MTLLQNLSPPESQPKYFLAMATQLFDPQAIINCIHKLQSLTVIYMTVYMWKDWRYFVAELFKSFLICTVFIEIYLHVSKSWLDVGESLYNLNVSLDTLIRFQESYTYRVTLLSYTGSGTINDLAFLTLLYCISFPDPLGDRIVSCTGAQPGSLRGLMQQYSG